MRSFGTGPSVAAIAREAGRRTGLLGGVGILGVLGWWLGSGPFLDATDMISSSALTAALAIGALTTVCSAWRWSLVADGLGMHLPLRCAVGDYYRALFLNAALPGGVLGDVHRAMRHGKDVGDVSLAVKAVVMERSAGQVVLVTAGVTVLLLDPPTSHTAVRSACAAVAATLVVVLLAGTFLVRKGAFPWARRVRSWVSDARRGLLSRRHGPRILIASAVILAGHLATFVVAAQAVGSTVPLTRLVPLLLLALLAMGLPLNVGGWGPREGVMAWAFGAADLSPAQGLTIAVGYGMCVLVASLPGAAVLAVRWAARRAPARDDPTRVGQGNL